MAGYVGYVEPIFAFAAAFLCAFSIYDGRTDPAEEKVGGAVAFASVAVGFIAGFATRLAMVAVFPKFDDSTFPLFPEEVLPAFIAVGLLFLWLICWILICRKGFKYMNDAPLLLFVLGTAFGMFAWLCLGRFVQLYHAFSAAGAIGCAAVLSFSMLFAAGFSGRIRQSRKRRRRMAEDESDELSQALKAAGLSPRELQASILCWEKKTSEESAWVMNVKAATVRSLLQRAYRKLGVASQAEFILACDKLVGKAADEKRISRWASNQTIMHRCKSVLSASTILVLCMVFLPFLVSRAGWGIGREFIYGIGAATLLIGSVRLANRSLAAGNAEWVKQCEKRAFFLSLLLGISTCVVGAACFVFADAIRKQAIDPLAQVVAFFAAFAFVLLLAYVNALAFRRDTRGWDSFTSTAWVVASVLLLLQSTAAYVWVAVAILAVSALGASAFLVCRTAFMEEDQSIGCAGRSYGIGAPVLPFAAFFALGFVWEESWRSLGYHSFMGGGVVFSVLAAILISATVFRVWKKGRTVICSMAAILIVAVCVGSGVLIVAVAIFCYGLLLVLRYIHGIAHSSESWSVPMAFGIGCIVSEIAIDHVGDRLGFGYWAKPFDAFQRASEVEIVAACLIFVLLLVALASVFLLCRNFSFVLKQGGRLPDLGTQDEERCLHFLQSRGLSEGHSRILLDIARGYSARDIIERQHYSKGSVNDARRKGYLLLGVHDRVGLAALILRETGL